MDGMDVFVCSGNCLAIRECHELGKSLSCPQVNGKLIINILK